MKLDSRRQAIMDLLIEHGSVGLEDLALRFGVSKMTIHRDLDDLEEAGLLRKVRGGASIESSSQFESDYRFRERRGTEEKGRIVRAALDLVEPGMTVLLNDGTTAALLAALLPARRPLTVITNNMAAIETLTQAQGVALIALGGTYSRKFNGFFGIVTETALERLRADIVFLSSPAIDGLGAFHMDADVARTKRMMLGVAARAYLLVDHGKFGRTALHHMGDLADFDGVITGARLPTDISGQLHDAGIALTVARD